MSGDTFSRMADIVRANINDLLDRAEDPENMIRQIILEMEEAVNKATASVATAGAGEKRLERHRLEKTDLVEVWRGKAELAVRSGEDDLARRALERKGTAERAAADLSAALEESRKTSEQLKRRLAQLKARLDETRMRQGTLIARCQAAEARKRIAEGISRIGDDAVSNFERFCRSVEHEEAEAEAREELADPRPSLEEAFEKLEREGSVEAELKALKQKLARTDA